MPHDHGTSYPLLPRSVSLRVSLLKSERDHHDVGEARLVADKAVRGMVSIVLAFCAGWGRDQRFRRCLETGHRLRRVLPPDAGAMPI